MVTRHARPGVLRRALAAGVKGFVPKSTPSEKLAEVIRTVVGGARYVRPGSCRRCTHRHGLPAHRTGARRTPCNHGTQHPGADRYEAPPSPGDGQELRVFCYRQAGGRQPASGRPEGVGRRTGLSKDRRATGQAHSLYLRAPVKCVKGQLGYLSVEIPGSALCASRRAKRW